MLLGGNVSLDLCAVLATVIGAALASGIAVIAIITGGLRGIRSDLADVRDRVSRMEGMMTTLRRMAPA